MHAIIGLGNPGSEYDGTRHNIGFEVVDAIAGEFRIELHAGSGEFWCGIHDDILLVKPTTYMNNSGIAVKDILDRFEIPLENLLVIFDDFHLPLGTLRLRRNGSSGGHNGIASILWQLGSDEFPRLRCGIDSEKRPKERHAITDFVLSRFAKEEVMPVQAMIARAREVAVLATRKNLQAAFDFLSTST